jgi:hypothetical protein
MKHGAIRFAAVVAVCVAAAAAIHAQAKVDMTGKWGFNVTTDAGTGTPTFTVKQDGEKLSGHYVGTLGEADFTGTNNGKDFTIAFAVDAQGTKLDVTYKGTFENKDSVKGSVSIAGLGEGTFTGKRQ